VPAIRHACSHARSADRRELPESFAVIVGFGRSARLKRLKLGEAELNYLVAEGYLSSDKRDDRRAVECAIDEFFFDWLRGQRVTSNGPGGYT
jgi:hypothetical protein